MLAAGGQQRQQEEEEDDPQGHLACCYVAWVWCLSAWKWEWNGWGKEQVEVVAEQRASAPPRFSSRL